MHPPTLGEVEGQKPRIKRGNEAENQKDAKLTELGACPAETEPSEAWRSWTMAERDASVGDSPSPPGVPGLGPHRAFCSLMAWMLWHWAGQGLRQEYFKIKSLIPELGARAPCDPDMLFLSPSSSSALTPTSPSPQFPLKCPESLLSVIVVLGRIPQKQS